MAAPSPTAAEYGPRAGILAPLPAAERGVASVLAVSPDGEYLAYAAGANVVVRSVKVSVLMAESVPAPGRNARSHTCVQHVGAAVACNMHL